MLKFVICGMEHSGTTLISDLFRQVPGLDAGFEGGVLLCQSPKEFEGFDPFFTNMLAGWKITKEELNVACHAETFGGFYERLQASAKVLRPDTTEIFDKTPRYLSRLDECLSRANVPFIVSFKDPRSIVHSDYTRSKETEFDKWYEAYVGAKLRYLTACYKTYKKVESRDEKNVAFVSLETLCMNARPTCDRLFGHVGIAFKTDFVLLSNQRYKHTRANSISARIPFEYKEILTAAQQRRISDDFAECQDWFYE